jgi:hypothetical protein
MGLAVRCGDDALLRSTCMRALQALDPRGSLTARGRTQGDGSSPRFAATRFRRRLKLYRFPAASRCKEM